MQFPIAEYSPESVSIRYRIDAEKGRRIEEYRGHVVLDDLKSMVSAIVSDPAWSPDHHGLIDLSAADLDLSSNDVLRFALHLRHHAYSSNGWLVFAVGNTAKFGTIRMLGQWARTGDRFRIFKTRSDAEAWLDRNANTRPLAPRPHRSLPTFANGYSARISA